MAKLSQQTQKSKNNNNNLKATNSSTVASSTMKPKVKRTRRSVPRDSPPQRRYEAHLWDKNCWNESQNKKGRQGAYDDEEAAAHAYDLAALKYWGQDTILNFPLVTYLNEIKEMEGQSREEYIGSLRRHHHNGRWEARIGRVFGNKYLYLGTYATQEEAATAYDMAAIEYRGLNAVTNFDLSRYIKWLKPKNVNNDINLINTNILGESNNNPNCDTNFTSPNPNYEEQGFNFFHDSFNSGKETVLTTQSRPTTTTATSALGLLLQSSKFKEMMEMASTGDDMPSPATPPCRFPEDIQTYFECEDSNGDVGEGDDDGTMFSEINTFVPPLFHYDDQFEILKC
ncbi:AP2-like ethylene-responsive transcription factor [Senna tora]|uniref:AP2-like ethylene-responsive transcription factor n=1 Tax=Senna tora TaxID=362788 RepID=A0A834SLI9_9FABA|nr:AP2-like ethylene-responsive transcription factor [Senna tora]